jgi:hypothetical protein
MTEVHDSKDKECSPDDSVSQSPVKDEELFEVVKALASQGFRFLNNREN